MIANPVAGGGKAARLARSFLAGNTELHFTEYAGHASVLAVQALTAGYRRIAVMGGDGTLHEVIQPLVGRVPREFEIEFLGGGTSCDFIRRHHSLQPTDIIQIDCHDEFGKPLRSYGVNGSNIGFVADATLRYNHAGILTRLAKKVSTDAGMLAAATCAMVSHRPLAIEVSMDGGPTQLLYLSNAVAFKTPWIGGGMQLADLVSHDDGMLGVILLDAFRARDLFGLILASYRGALEAHPRIRVHRCREISLTPERPIRLESDGELIGYTPVRYSVQPRALSL
ncbi:MAG TPA: diacylglycerol kinase family protein [Terrimicrobiaceae bacterium]|nr:diacylglycerol kinase family protein [Terrimicrobiaceae bacterium]